MVFYFLRTHRALNHRQMANSRHISSPARASRALPSVTRRVGTIFCFLLLVACVGVERAPPQGKAVAVEPSTTRSTGPGAARTDSPEAKTAPKVPAGQARKQETLPTLDLASLEKRLRETDAIGVFTKITLKNQVDDLLNQFRAHYQGRSKTTLAELRLPYDMLLLKVLSLLQDGDPPLARVIVASREAIWGILADPAKFATL